MRGSAHYKAKLTEDDVRLIRECLAERERLLREARKLSNKRLGEKFDVTEVCIENIAYFRSWCHVRI